MTTRRDEYRPLIAAIIAEVGTDDLRELRRILRERFPIGLREYHPYKIWLDEIRVQLGLKKPHRPEAKPAKPVVPCEGQRELF